MRRALLQILLLAVFLNAAIGVPLHAAVHLVGGAGTQVIPFSAVEPAAPDGGDDHDDRPHTPCAWCLVHAEATGAPPAALDAPLALDRHGRHARPVTAVDPVFSTGLWSSSPRGPPLL